MPSGLIGALMRSTVK